MLLTCASKKDIPFSTRKDLFAQSRSAPESTKIVAGLPMKNPLNLSAGTPSALAEFTEGLSGPKEMSPALAIADQLELVLLPVSEGQKEKSSWRPAFSHESDHKLASVRQYHRTWWS